MMDARNEGHIADPPQVRCTCCGLDKKCTKSSPGTKARSTVSKPLTFKTESSCIQWSRCSCSRWTSCRASST
eukprot:3512082-Pyramimonas_sp.AAC.1